MKTAEELGITEKEYGALLKVREMLAAGEIKAEMADDLGKALFNMNTTSEVTSCGTVACIGGWMSIVMQGAKPNAAGFYEFDDARANDYVKAFMVGSHSDQSTLAELFYPRGVYGPWENITTEQAVQAIDYYLRDGKPCWAEIAHDRRSRLDRIRGHCRRPRDREPGRPRGGEET